ncbi:O-antigen translocase [Cognataquiflexum rubidum]|uniref:O-antigen translocase n=1 Tax=Cognataquiflexum rubidum TaxID=2922273 RepID=UPI001F12B63B|nr:O-antigen translocase [Cognataquiflexum rubidum]MCH6234323.1 O-antigen translocase [Cognataquiflexum rubidum]
MSEERASYRQIMKATSIFGGVQVFNIIIALIRSKAIAILLGPTGIGVAGLLTSTTGMISSLTNFGLGTSAVKDIASAHSSENDAQLAKTTTVFKKLVWLTGILGTVLTIVFSPLLSELTFGNKNYTWSFVLIAITVLLGQLTNGQNVILQGTRNLKFLATANMVGSLLSLIITLPLYYFLGMDGIVPALVIMGFVTFLVAQYFGNKLKIRKILLTKSEVVKEGNSMLKLGFVLSLSGIITSIVAYVVRIYISNTGGLDDVGFYSAGFQIIGTYVGLVFTAMGTDFFPKLSAIALDENKVNSLVNQQSEITILVLGPILLFFILLINWVIILLYSENFLEIDDMMRWSALGMFFKAASWPLGFIFLAKGATGTFFKSELFFNFYFLVFNILGYKFFGLAGLGIAFLISYILVYIQVYLISYFKYKFIHGKIFFKLFLSQFCLAMFGFIIIQQPLGFINTLIMVIIVFTSIIISAFGLYRRYSTIN